MIDEVPAAALLDRFYMVGRKDAPRAWQEYVDAVREIAGDESAPPEMRSAAVALARTLRSDAPPARDEDPGEEDPEGFGMDEQPEGGVDAKPEPKRGG